MKTIVLSLDALGSGDREIFERTRGFKQLIEKGLYVRKVRGINPSLTYPSHASILTGRRPDSHRIVNNGHYYPYTGDFPWYMNFRDIKGDNLIKVALDKGLRVASLYWPTTVDAIHQYNLPEIFGKDNDETIALQKKHGTSWLVEELEESFGYLKEGDSQPQLDNFIFQSFLYIFETYQPDLSFIHLTGVDVIKHQLGTGAKEVEAAIENYGRIIEGLLELKDVNLLATSDHSMVDIHTGIRINVFLKNQGYIQMEGDRVINYTAYAQDASGSCYIYTENLDQEQIQELGAILENFSKETQAFKLLAKEEIKVLGADSQADFMLDGRTGYYFLREPQGPLMDTSLPKHVATHGYVSDFKEDYFAVLFGYGDIFEPGIIEEIDLIDIAPSLADALGLDLYPVEGKIIDNIRRKKC